MSEMPLFFPAPDVGRLECSITGGAVSLDAKLDPELSGLAALEAPCFPGAKGSFDVELLSLLSELRFLAHTGPTSELCKKGPADIYSMGAISPEISDLGKGFYIRRSTNVALFGDYSNEEKREGELTILKRELIATMGEPSGIEQSLRKLSVDLSIHPRVPSPKEHPEDEGGVEHSTVESFEGEWQTFTFLLLDNDNRGRVFFIVEAKADREQLVTYQLDAESGVVIFTVQGEITCRRTATDEDWKYAIKQFYELKKRVADSVDDE